MESMLYRALDRESSIPLYDQLQGIILDAIQNGDLQKGDRLPNERMLQSIYTVSRSTVRRALESLEGDGYIRRVQGSGTEVISRSPYTSSKVITSFTQDTLDRGMQPSSKTLSVEAVSPPASVMQAWKMDPGQAVWQVRRLRLADDTPIVLNDLYIPKRFHFTATELMQMRSYYELMERKFQIRPHQAMDNLSASKANAEQAQALGIHVGDSLILQERFTETHSHEPFEYTIIYFIPEFFEYKLFLEMPSD